MRSIESVVKCIAAVGNVGALFAEKLCAAALSRLMARWVGVEQSVRASQSKAAAPEQAHAGQTAARGLELSLLG